MTQPELDVIDTPIFQRLHNIRQLGTVYTVFPGATHTRFAHSLGVMQIVDRLVTSRGLRRKVSRDERERLRMAALLHDVGHYPLSHVVETVMNKHNTRKEGNHEELSGHVVTKHLARILVRNGFDPNELSKMIRGRSELLHTQLLSSELDADRMDYLLRDSQNTGVRYGGYDIDRLVHSVQLDKDGRLAVHEKGKHAAEDYMIARYHMYLSVYSHKVTMGFAELVQHAYDMMMNSDNRPYGVYDLNDLHKLNAQQFAHFDDNYLFTKLSLVGQKGYLSKIVEMIMKREPLEVALEANEMMVDGMVNERFFRVDQIQYADELKKVAKESGVPTEWIFHSNTKTQLSTLQLSYRSSALEEGKSKEMDIAIHIVDDKGKSKPLVADATSLAHYLSQLSLAKARIFTSAKHKPKLEDFLEKRYGAG